MLRDKQQLRSRRLCSSQSIFCQSIDSYQKLIREEKIVEDTHVVPALLKVGRIQDLSQPGGGE